MEVDARSGYCAATATFHSLYEPVSLPTDPFLSFPQVLARHHNPSSLAYIDAPSGQSITYAELWQRISFVAGGLSRFGVQHGDVVLLLAPNSIHYPLLLLAVMAIGAVVTTANPLNTPAEIAKQRQDSGSKFLCTIPALLHKLDLSESPLILISEDPNEKPQASKAPRCVLITELLDPGNGLFLAARVRQNDTAALLYSSGTTGVSKGVIITHKNLIAMVLILPEKPNPTPIVSLCFLPLFHIYGLAICAGALLYIGATTVIMHKFVLEDMLALIERYKVTHMPAVPPILTALAKSKIVEKYDLSSLIEVACGAAPLSKEVADSFHARFPNISIVQGYGMTESAVVASSDANGEYKYHQSVGRLLPNFEAKIVDTVSGKSLPPNKPGELLLHSPTIMKGYFANPDATTETLDSEGWLHTGDLCYIDEDGNLFVVDRLKEMIKYKGLQVSPAELEDTLLSHLDIIDAAVIPFPDAVAGQVPMAFVVKRPGSKVTERDLINFVTKQVAPYKKIRRIAFVNAIPKSVTGKILRRELVSQATSKL